MRLLATLALMMMASTAFGRFDGSVTYTKGDGRECHGTFIQSSGSRAMLTVAHCLDNFYDGGIRLNDGSTSAEVFVASSVRSRGAASNDDDIALVIFPADSSRGTSRFSRQVQNSGDSVSVVTTRSGVRRNFSEAVQEYTMDSTQSYSAFITASNGNARLIAGDSGAALYDASDRLIGLLRGCVPAFCGFFSLDQDNSVTTSVFSQAAARYPALFSDTAPPVPGPSPVPTPLQYFTCSAQCAIEYSHPDNVAYETVQAYLIRAKTSYEAQSMARNQLDNYCQGFCSAGSDAFACTLTTSVSCL